MFSFLTIEKKMMKKFIAIIPFLLITTIIVAQERYYERFFDTTAVLIKNSIYNKLSDNGTLTFYDTETISNKGRKKGLPV